ncbi:MAG: bifunctional diaminohydroxyphosphoribosylaminopyrimidine deaminase/5-amino-6-(5-phosphoribosylamino)uracil reductase RibD [Muribaculaceae bacterium]
MKTGKLTDDERYMRRALQLAALGEGNVSPNPMVGAVIVADGRIIGEGYHRCYGEGHAEVNAVASVTDRSLLRGATIYVTLEPCSHYGKTPPCAKLLIDCGFGRVVVGVRDPFAKVSGRGIAMLRDAGIEVTEGVLEAECRHINRRFITAHSLGRPWVLLKWAQSSDGFIDAPRCLAPDEAGQSTAATVGEPVKFSTPITAVWMHRERAGVDAILVGANTVALDNPSLTVRGWSVRRQPLRVVLAGHSPVPPDAKLLTDGLPTLIYSSDLHTVLADLYHRGITSLMVEGGAAVLQSFIDARLYDEVRIETAPITLGSGIKAPTLPAESVSLLSHKACGSNTIDVFSIIP